MYMYLYLYLYPYPYLYLYLFLHIYVSALHLCIYVCIYLYNCKGFAPAAGPSTRRPRSRSLLRVARSCWSHLTCWRRAHKSPDVSEVPEAMLFAFRASEVLETTRFAWFRASEVRETTVFA